MKSYKDPQELLREGNKDTDSKVGLSSACWIFSRKTPSVPGVEGEVGDET